METLSTCQCCEGLSVEVPAGISNRPGLDAVLYRVGTQPQFRESLLARLSSSGQSALYGLTTRENDDFSIALLDAWAVVADVLTFYQERIVNESYLRTATERLSILELARLTGYELGPGVAADTYLAFTLNDNPGALGPVLSVAATPNAQLALPPVTIPPGTPIKSIPAPGEQPQTFETSAPIVAHAEWNFIRPRLTQPQVLTTTTSLLIVSGAATGIKKGDVLLINAGGSSKLRKVLKVTPDQTLQTTRLDLAAQASLPPYNPPVWPRGLIYDIGARSILRTGTLQLITGRSWAGSDLTALIGLQQWSRRDLVLSIRQAVTQTVLTDQNAYIFRQRAAVFGYNAPKKFDPDVVATSWSDWNLSNSEQPGTLWLDNAYDQVLPESWIGVQEADKEIEDSPVVQVKTADARSRTDYGISSKSTVVTFDPVAGWSQPKPPYDLLTKVRSITIHAQSELLDLPDLPIIEDVAGKTIELDGLYLGLVPGQKMILTGERTDLPGVSASELVTLDLVEANDGRTSLTFLNNLSFTYKRSSTTLNGNVAPANHGATVSEVLGNGDATRTFQEFVLKQSPLTYTSSRNAAGSATSLSVRVNDLLWKEVPYFFGHGPNETIYITRRDNAGNTTVIFGDGSTGMRLPTGQSNVKASYRVGTGTPGLLQANQLSQLTNAPAGVKSAVNPLAPAGAEDPEDLAHARENATLTILTLDRVVSLQDYADFARAFAGIGKSLATWTWNGQRRCIYLTVAGAGGAPIDDDLKGNLADAILANGDPHVPLTVASYQPVYFQLTVNIVKDPVYLADKITGAVEAALRDHFSFERRAFGQPVAFSEVVSVIQDVPGVVATDIRQLYISGQDPDGELPSLLPAKQPQPGTEAPSPAELLTLDPRPLNLNILP